MIKIIYAFLLILTFEFVFNNYSSAQTGKWTQLFPLNSPPPRYAHGLASLGNGKILLFGGAKSGVNINDTWIYDFAENNWTEINCTNKPSPRIDFAMSYIDSGKVILFGGNTDEDYSNETWLFDINKMNWEKLILNKTPSKREATSFAYLGNNQMLIFSGHPWQGPERFIPDTWIFDFKNLEWDSIKYTGEYPLDRWHGMMSTFNENSILLYGGYGNGNIGGDVNDTWIFDNNKKVWSIINPLVANKKRSISSMAQLEENYILIFGGDTQRDSGQLKDQWSDDTWIFDGINNTWIELIFDTKPEGRYVHSLAQIDKSKVLLFGGETSHSTLKDTWLFEFEPNSIEENNLLNSLNISPNPVTDYMTLSIPPLEKRGLGGVLPAIKIFDIFGNLVLSVETIHELSLQIDVSMLTPGIYFIKLGAQPPLKFVKI